MPCRTIANAFFGLKHIPKQVTVAASVRKKKA